MVKGDGGENFTKLIKPIGEGEVEGRKFFKKGIREGFLSSEKSGGAVSLIGFGEVKELIIKSTLSVGINDGELGRLELEVVGNEALRDDTFES